ncbi:MAG: hypothetical protein U0794_12085 [Isosphaeraceae bacterium]
MLLNVLVPRLAAAQRGLHAQGVLLGDGDDAALWDILPLSGTIANRIAHWSGKIGVGPLSPFGSLRAPLPDGSWSGTIYELSGSLSSLALDQKRPDPKKIPTETVIKYLLAEPRPNPERMIGAFARSIDSFNRPLGSDSMHPAAITFGLPALKGEPNAPGESTKYRIQLGLLQYVPPALRLGVTNDNLDGKQDLTTTFESSTRFRMRIQDVLGSDGKSLIGRGARIANRAMTTPEGYVSSLAELTGAKTLPEPTQGDVVVFEYDPKATSTIDGTLVLVNDLGTKNHLKFAIDRPMLGAR